MKTSLPPFASFPEAVAAPAAASAPVQAEACYTVAVRALAEFAAREGSLDLRFTPSPSAQEGMAGHAAVAQNRGEGYQAEIRLEGRWRNLVVRGRADGYDPASRRLEEIKTVRGEPVAIPENHRKLHWAQAKVYGWLLCESLGLEELDIAIVYYDIVARREYPSVERFPAKALREGFEMLCARFLQWAQAEIAHRRARDTALARLAFPHRAFRAGQRTLAESVYKANVAARVLLAQAPTGIGKSVGTVFPALKAMPGQQIDKLLFLCARSTGRAVALDAARRIRQATGQAAGPAIPLRVLELVARDKACEYPGAACHGESCPLADGFHDRLPAARQAACDMAANTVAGASPGLLDRDAIREIGRRHRVCPYFLGQEMARWSDLIVADYNYYFDRTALLHALATMNGWRLSVLVDEAHNLVERGRAMYTAQLSRDALRAAVRAAPAQAAAPLRRVARQWDRLVDAQPVSAAGYAAVAALPAALHDALQQAGAALLECLSELPAPSPARPAAGATPPGISMQQFCFDMLHFVQLAEQMGPHSLFDLEVRVRDAKGGAGSGRAPRRPESRLTVRNMVPAPFLRPRLAAAHSVTLFSATLGPRDYYADMLGLPRTHAYVEVPSPFDAAQLQVRIANRISTRFSRRTASLPALVALIAAQYRACAGNYLAFFSSHEYLAQASELLARRCPEIPQWAQSRRMDEAACAAFLDAFAPAGKGVGFAVLGGVFAEGVDLPGDRLVGAFVATLGLPQVNPVNEQMRERLGQAFGHGYEYAYLYPGLRKVVQAAGRVIRTREDRGVVYLIDDRFARPEVRALLPAWWEPRIWHLGQNDAEPVNPAGCGCAGPMHAADIHAA